MRTFIVLCLLALACADKLGYNYQPVDHSEAGLSFAPGGVGADDSGIGSASNDAPSFAGGELDKEFYTFSANDEEFEQPEASNQISNALKQSLRVVFVKSPENKALEHAALNLAKSASDQQTAIYVLTKQADIGELANKFNAVRNDNNKKPEVHFVKYRTPEDAANAQRTIQSQFDSLGGTSRSHDGGVAPVINFASQAPAGGHGGFGGSQGGQGGYGAEQATAAAPNYLPPSIFRRFRL